MAKTITISVIIPVYNMEQFLVRCLDSVITQTYPHLEIILVDDGSRDKSPQICDEYAAKDNRIQVIHKTNAGVSAARNTALDVATGDYISFVDSDDWIEPNMYEVIVNHLAQEDIDIIRFNAERNGEILNALHFEGSYEGDRLQNEIILPMIGAEKFGGMFILGMACIYLYKRSLIEDNKIRVNINLRRCEDRLFCITAMLHARCIQFLQDVFYHYELVETSLSNRYDSTRWTQELFFLGELRQECKKKGTSFAQKAEKRISAEYILRAVASINNEFFSNNNNSFLYRMKRIALIINNAHVKQSIKHLETEPLGWKGKLILFFIKHRLVLLLTLLQTIILEGGKLKNK